MMNLIWIVLIVLAVGLLVNTIEKEVNKSKWGISFKESLDLTELPVITFMNNNKKLNFLLDTGSNMSHINLSELNNLEYENLHSSTSLVGIEGNSVNYNIYKIKISYKDKEFEDAFMASDLSGAFNNIKSESGVTIHGILGSRFFEKYKYTIDFKDLKAYIK